MTQNNNVNYQQISKSNTTNKALDIDDSWIEKIWEWADKFELLDSEVPRSKEALLAMKKLEILEPDLDEQHSRDVYRMYYIPDELTFLTNLIEINLSGLYSSHLPQNIGQLTNLTKLSISHSNLIALPDSIGQLSNLTELFINESKIKELPDSISQLTSLNKLFISRC